MLSFAAVEGSATIRAEPKEFIAAFVKRIGAGLLGGGPGPRVRYVVTRAEANRLEFRAEGWLTAFNVGLNEVNLAVSSDGTVRYSIRYPRWAGYAIALSALIGLLIISFLLFFDVRGYLASHPASMFPGLSMDQNVAIGWAMALFWGFVWPWILIALHKRPLRKLMETLIAEVDAEASRRQS